MTANKVRPKEEGRTTFHDPLEHGIKSGNVIFLNTLASFFRLIQTLRTLKSSSRLCRNPVK